MKDDFKPLSDKKDNLAITDLAEHAFEAIYTVTPDGTITSWNKGAEHIYGYTEKDVLGNSASILVPKDKADEVSRILEVIKEDKKVEHLETQRISRDGAPVDILLTATPIKSEGKVTGALVFHKDITLQKEAERKYSELFEQASDAIFIADLDGHYTDVNNAACTMLGYSKDELLGKTILDLIPPEDADRLWKAKELLSTAGQTRIDEWMLKKKDGSYLPVEVSAKILSDGRWQAFVRDLSKEKEIEKKFQFIFESAPDPQLIMDSDGRIQMANQQCEATFGFTREELEGHKVDMLVPERLRETQPIFQQDFFKDSNARRMGGGQQLWLCKKDGMEIQVDILISTISIDNKPIVLATIRDLSEIKKLADYARNIGDTVNRLYYSYH